MSDPNRMNLALDLAEAALCDWQAEMDKLQAELKAAPAEERQALQTRFIELMERHAEIARRLKNTFTG